MNDIYLMYYNSGFIQTLPFQGENLQGKKHVAITLYNQLKSSVDIFDQMAK